MSLDAHAASVGARVAGGVIAFGYLVGLVPGPIVAVVGGLALITLGRALLLDRHRALLGVLALAVIAGGVGIGALRWATLDLAEIRGAQRVLGPTLLVGPPAAALASWIGAGSALLGLTLWQLASAPLLTSSAWPAALEGVLAAGAVASAFWGPVLVIGGDADAPQVLLDALSWLAVLLAATAAPLVASAWLASRAPIWWWRSAVLALVGVAAALGVIGGPFA